MIDLMYYSEYLLIRNHVTIDYNCNLIFNLFKPIAIVLKIA